VARVLALLAVLSATGAALVILLDRGDAPTPPAAAERVPILIYHAISKPPGSAEHRELYVAPDDFAAQMSWLVEHGFEAVTLAELRAGWSEASPLPPKPVVISFDDGLQTQFTTALPVLRDHDWPGVLNLKVESLRQEELTEAMIGRMISEGWEVNSHSVTHPKLTEIGQRELEREVAESRRILEERLGVPIEFFCYPYGRFDARVVGAVRRAGYLGATTTRRGLASANANPFLLPRLRVDGSEGLAEFASKISSLEADV
jgi:peptidoglycan/xylan/chitin deacetylase (PgdA/CDA1 family)